MLRKEMSKRRYRLVVLGSGKVGKTAIIRRYLHGAFDDKYRETIEDLYSRDFNIQGIPISLDILDTNCDYPDMRKVAVASASALMLVFAVDDVPSFKQMSDIWTEVVQQRKDARDIPVVVVGNKCDSSSQKIFEATAQAWTQRLNSNIRYVEASAKTAHNIVKIFRSFLEQSGLLKDEKMAAASSFPTYNKQSDELTTTLSDINVSNCSHAEKRTKQQIIRTRELSSLQTLHRNQSLRAITPKNNEFKCVSRSSSFMQRTKHLSLRTKRHEKEVAVTPADECDCKIS